MDITNFQIEKTTILKNLHIQQKQVDLEPVLEAIYTKTTGSILRRQKKLIFPQELLQ